MITHQNLIFWQMQAKVKKYYRFLYILILH